MAKAYNRLQRINDLVQTTLAGILLREAKDLRFGMVTITGVEVAQDLSHAKVYVSVLEDDKASESIAALNNASKYLRYSLANAVELRVTPELKFVYDDSTLRGNRITSLINDALKSDENTKPKK